MTTRSTKTPTIQIVRARIAQRAYKSQSRVSRFRRDLEAAYAVSDYPESGVDLAYDTAVGKHKDLPYEEVALRYSVAVEMLKGLLAPC